MNQTTTTGPVAPDSLVYVERPFEQAMRQHAFRRDWILLLGPRQHGKTSALRRLSLELSADGFHVAFVDLQNLAKADKYVDLLRAFSDRISAGFGIQITEPTGEASKDLSAWLSAALPLDEAPVVIFVDEASAIPLADLRHSFFGQMRALKNAADGSAAGSVERRVQFIFAGTFRPNRLVPEALNSPFNVSEEVYSEDLTSDDVLNIAQLIDADVDVALPARIYSVVGGQPYLVQKLIQSYEGLPPEQRHAALEVALDRLSAEGNHHTDSLFGLTLAEKALADAVSDVALNGSCANQPTEEFRFLRTIGLMRRDGDQMRFRNALYETLAKRSAQVLPDAHQAGQVADAAVGSHFYRLDPSAFDFVADLQLREVALSFHNSAVDAINAKGYRVAMVAFGVCGEAILIDWLKAKTDQERAGAIAASRAAQVKVKFIPPFEDEALPMTWRLVNLVNVARQMNALRGPLEVSEALRNMRNYVHPGKICEAYLAEEAMEPEAVTAGSLVAAVMRDLRP